LHVNLIVFVIIERKDAISEFVCSSVTNWETKQKAH